MKLFFLARMTTAFTPATVENQPLGGSESALLYISSALARRGHEVTIVNTCSPREAGLYEGVRYVNFTTLKDAVALTRKNRPDFFVAFRDFPALLFPFEGALKTWWGHDDFSNVWAARAPLGSLGRFALRRLAGPLIRRKADHLFVVSDWLASLCRNLLGYPAYQIHVVRNGLNLPYFENSHRNRRMKRLVYTSTPQRGLEILLDLFPAIRLQVPEAELFVYCGYDRGVLSSKDHKAMQVIFQKADQPGVSIVGTRPHRELAQELAEAALWIYPNHAVPEIGFYAETSCIAAMESMAAGTPVIASARGALPELIQNGKTGFLIPGDPHSKAHHHAFIKQTVRLLEDRPLWESLSTEARRQALSEFSWEKRAVDWEKTLEVLLRKRS